MKKFLIFSLLVGSLGFGQNYVATQTFTLSGTAAVLTIQQPATIRKAAKFIAVDVESTINLTFSLERDGGGATTTQFTPAPLNPSDGPANMVGYTNSNAGVGVVLGNYVLVANGFKVIDLSNIQFQQSQTNRNLTIRTSAVTGTVNITIRWLEQQQ